MKGGLVIAMFVVLLFLCCFTTASCFPNGLNPLIQNSKGEESCLGVIDVYSQKGGKGPNTETAAVQVQEDVFLYAEVTYDGIPLEGKGVVFEVRGPNGQFNTLDAYTNSSGIASTVLHMTWPCSHPELTLGTWSVKAKTVYEDCSFEDVLTFSYGWILDVLSVEAGTLVNGTYWVPRVYFTRTTTVDVRLTIKNINNTSETAVLFSICYQNDTPLGYRYLTMEIAAKATQSFILQGVDIPAWAPLGDGTVYANCFTDWPSHGGMCYCPEKSTTLTIVQEDYDIDPPVLSNVAQEPETPLKDQEVNVSVSVTSWERYPFEVALFYREDNNTEWNSAIMTNIAGTYQATIPGFPADTRVSYVVVACDSAGNSAVDDNAGNYHIYDVIPEFSNLLSILLLLVILTTVSCVMSMRKRLTIAERA
jgi:hypothetical protein